MLAHLAHIVLTAIVGDEKLEGWDVANLERLGDAARSAAAAAASTTEDVSPDTLAPAPTTALTPPVPIFAAAAGTFSSKAAAVPLLPSPIQEELNGEADASAPAQLAQGDDAPPCPTSATAAIASPASGAADVNHLWDDAADDQAHANAAEQRALAAEAQLAAQTALARAEVDTQRSAAQAAEQRALAAEAQLADYCTSATAELEDLRHHIAALAAEQAAASAAVATSSSSSMGVVRPGDVVSCLFSENGKQVRYFGRAEGLSVDVKWDDGDASTVSERRCRREEDGGPRSRKKRPAAAVPKNVRKRARQATVAAAEPEQAETQVFCSLCQDHHDEGDASVIRLTCGHSFCREVLARWAERSAGGGTTTRRGTGLTCPICRGRDRISV